MISLFAMISLLKISIDSDCRAWSSNSSLALQMYEDWLLFPNQGKMFNRYDWWKSYHSATENKTPILHFNKNEA